MRERVCQNESLSLIRDRILSEFLQSSTPTYHFGACRLAFYSRSCSAPLSPHFYAPMAIVVIQGAKEVCVGSEEFRYGPGVCFLCGVDIPVTSCVVQADAASPYLALSLTLNLDLLAELTAKMPPIAQANLHFLGAQSLQLDPDLLDAFARLVELARQAKPVLADLVIREIHFRLLESSFGVALRSLVTCDSQAYRISQVISHLKAHFAEPFSVKKLADLANMAPSTLHKYFKEITAVSPLQYQKRLRLGEARRLLLAEALDVTEAAMRVGYESSTQFIREYKRLFGEPPRRSLRQQRSK